MNTEKFAKDNEGREQVDQEMSLSALDRANKIIRDSELLERIQEGRENHRSIRNLYARASKAYQQQL
jgi:hypothetical protein